MAIHFNKIQFLMKRSTSISVVNTYVVQVSGDTSNYRDSNENARSSLGSKATYYYYLSHTATSNKSTLHVSPVPPNVHHTHTLSLARTVHHSHHVQGYNIAISR